MLPLAPCPPGWGWPPVGGFWCGGGLWGLGLEESRWPVQSLGSYARSLPPEPGTLTLSAHQGFLGHSDGGGRDPRGHRVGASRGVGIGRGMRAQS